MREALVIGGGAREHAIIHALNKSGVRVFASPGNGGIERDATILSAQSPDDIVDYFDSKRPLVIIGPEGPLANGWADRLRERGFPVVGPSEEAARLESSKDYAKAVMSLCGIPTANSRTARSAEELRLWISQETVWPKVLKLSGLAQGKGVHIVESAQDAENVVREWHLQQRPFDQGVLFEDYLVGYEVSVQVLTNGTRYEWLPVAQDYKRLSRDPHSPNTGGMGAQAPFTLLTEDDQQQINQLVFDPIMQYLADHRLVYRGVLYAGIMMTETGPKVLEFNVRLGDPETEVIIPIMTCDWWDVWYAVSQGEVPELPKPSSTAVAVVMAAKGYPGSPRQGMAITVDERLDHAYIYHAGTEGCGGHWRSVGGRVLAVVGEGATIQEARTRAYAQVAKITFPQSYYRDDIARSTDHRSN